MTLEEKSRRFTNHRGVSGQQVQVPGHADLLRSALESTHQCNPKQKPINASTSFKLFIMPSIEYCGHKPIVLLQGRNSLFQFGAYDN